MSLCQTVLVVRWNRWLTKGSCAVTLTKTQPNTTLHDAVFMCVRARVSEWARAMPPLPLACSCMCCSGEFSAVTWLRIHCSSNQMGVGQNGRLLGLTCTLVCLRDGAKKNAVTCEWGERPLLRPCSAFATRHSWYDDAGALIRFMKI